MGQLERYGLYVLCVVIVLILGVAIWGGDPADATTGVDLDRIAEQAAEDDWSRTELDDAAVGDTIAPPSLPEGFFKGETGGQGAADDAIDLGADYEPVAPPEPGVPETSTPTAADDSPDGEPTGETVPVSTAALRKYVVQDGDTMERIAKRELGSIKYVDRIKDLNPGVAPKRMQIGQKLTLPQVDEAASESGDAPRRSTQYTVKNSDTIFDIAQKVYGTAKYMKLIIEANRIEDPKRLKPGRVLTIPPRPDR